MAIRVHSTALNREVPPEFVEALQSQHELMARDRERRMAVIPPSIDVMFEVVGCRAC
jgi:hypothetical protein